MEEQKEQIKEVPVEDALTKAEAIVARLEEANKKSEEIMARAIISGRASAGTAAQEISPQEMKKKGALEFFKGTEIEKAIQKHG